MFDYSTPKNPTVVLEPLTALLAVAIECSFVSSPRNSRGSRNNEPVTNLEEPRLDARVSGAQDIEGNSIS